MRQIELQKQQEEKELRHLKNEKSQICPKELDKAKLEDETINAMCVWKWSVGRGEVSQFETKSEDI